MDDAHLMDEAGTHALFFALRRLQAEAVVVLVTARDGEACRFTEAGLPTLALTGLDPAAVAASVQRAAGVDAAGEAFERLYRETAGNPLALLEAAPVLRERAWPGQEAGDPLPGGSAADRTHKTVEYHTTAPEPPSLEPTGSVPQRVVGVWCGGRNDTASGRWTYAFADDGRFTAANRDGGFSGIVETEGDTMTFYVQGGRPVRSTWSVSYEEALGFDTLYLDGFSYVPGSCDS
ncbi:hypothetical protein [Streptomyces sp. NPDC006334]|uniref:hypothetical protein n=1 Tax=Streptomyces sp. NPDC006334 TaxID=3156754 RepID=UPI0033B5D566